MAYQIGAPKKVKMTDISEIWKDENTFLFLRPLSDEKAMELLAKKKLITQMADGEDVKLMKEAMSAIKDVLMEGIADFEGFEFPNITNGASVDEKKEALISEFSYIVKQHVTAAISRLTMNGDPLGNVTSSES
jgi:hypothetical protein